MVLGYEVTVAVTISVEPGMMDRWHIIILRRSEFVVISSGEIIIAGLRGFLIGFLGDQVVYTVCLTSYT